VTREAPEAALLRPITPADIPACIDVFYRALDELYGRLDQPLPPRDPGPMSRLILHLLDHDAERAWLAESPASTGDPDGPEVLGFGAAAQRETTWFLSLLFVRPGAQAQGLGRRLLLRTFPSGPVATDGVAGDAPGTLSTCVDSIQPISTGLYARYGIVPREPVFSAIGRPDPGVLPSLPRDVVGTAFEALSEEADLAGALAAVDRATVGYARPVDHAFWERERRRGLLFRRAGSGEILGYGYSQSGGRLGPLAMLDETLIPAALGALINRETPPGPYLALVPGRNDRAMVALLRAGFRFEGFPGIVSSTRPQDGLGRYLVASFALP